MEDAPGVLASVDMAFEPPPAITRDVRILLFLLVLERSGMSMIREANLCEIVVLFLYHYYNFCDPVIFTLFPVNKTNRFRNNSFLK